MKFDSAEKKIVKDFIKHYNAFQIDKMMDLFTDDCIFENVTNSSETVKCIGKKELKDFASTSGIIFKERKQTPINWIIEKDKIAVETDFEGTLALDLPDGNKTGDVIKLRGVSIYELENQKIKRLVDFS